LPSKGVEQIVNDRVLRFDKGSCERILQRILNEKQDEDYRKEAM
jgi:hypothetical protein